METLSKRLGKLSGMIEQIVARRNQCVAELAECEDVLKEIGYVEPEKSEKSRRHVRRCKPSACCKSPSSDVGRSFPSIKPLSKSAEAMLATFDDVETLTLHQLKDKWKDGVQTIKHPGNFKFCLNGLLKSGRMARRGWIFRRLKD